MHTCYSGNTVLKLGSIRTCHDCALCLPLQAGQFGGDNRAGIDRTLHRISAIRNRDGKVIGLTCRIGRAVLGSAAIAADLARAGAYILSVQPFQPSAS